MRVSAVRRVGCCGRRPGVSHRVVTGPATKEWRLRTRSTPENHFAPSPYRNLVATRIGGADCAGRSPRIGSRVVATARIEVILSVPAPDDHLTPGPDH